MSTNSGTNDSAVSNGSRPELPDFTTSVVWHDAPDFELQSLADLTSSSLDITLYLPWGLTTGTTTTGQAFFEEQAARVRAEGAGTDQEEAIDLFVRTFLDSPAERYSREPTAEELMHQGHDLTRFIHLRNVRSLVGGRLVAQELLRVQLSHVTAWAYGRSPLDAV